MMQVDLLIRNVEVFNAYLKKFVLADVAVLDGKYLYIGTEETGQLQPGRIIDGQGKYLVPGLIDIHMHIESTMAAPLTFTRALAANGVTTIVAEPHEIGNVFGVEGIKALLSAAKNCPVDVLLAIPSSVPSTSNKLETSGSEIGVDDLDEMLKMNNVACLGEVMNYVDVVYNPDSKSNQLIKHFREKAPRLPVEGHCPRLSGLELAKFIFAGVDSDHTEQTLTGTKERISNGMFVEIQAKSLKPEIIHYLTENDLYEHFALVTDDVMPDTLATRGHLNYLVKKAISLGMKPEMAIYAATYTPALRMGLRDRGSIAPGKLADFVLLDNAETFSICQTFKRGHEVFNRAAQPEPEERDQTFPPHFYHSVKLAPLGVEQFTLTANRADGPAKCRLLTVSSSTTFTKEDFALVPVQENVLDWEATPYCLAAVFERHGKNGSVGYGLVGGDVLRRGAVATTYAHDHHNLLVLGRNKRDMMIAANLVIEQQGGYYVVEDGEVIGKADLPIAGILSDKPINQLSEEMKGVTEALQHLGYKHSNVIMSISTLSLPVSQELKLTDKGLIRVNEQRLVPLVAE